MYRLILTIAVIFAFNAASHAQTEKAAFSFLPKKRIPVSKLGVNAFANDPRFGSVASQLREVRRTLRLRHIRVLFAWNDQVQPSPSSAIDFSFYDDIVSHIPSTTKAIVVLTDVPTWMSNSNNWTDGDPRKTFAERWAKVVAARYASKKKILGYEVWNEPNTDMFDENSTLSLTKNPENYVALLRSSAQAIREVAPQKLIISAATTAINQDYPDTLNYNKDLFDLGLESLVDIWAVHFYGSGLESVIFPGGVADFLNDLQKPIWLTEIGEKGYSQQREYMERYLPFLIELIPGIARAYYYQFTDSTSADNSYGLRNLTPGKQYSDLYQYLKSRSR